VRRLIEALATTPLVNQRTEIVERKGLGHPDSICDGAMEHLSQVMAREYVERSGAIQHYNFDKCLLAAGSVEHRFGGGRVLAPMRLVIGDRATFEANGVAIPVADVAREATAAWFRANLPGVHPDRHLEIDVALRPASPELAGLFRPGGGPPPANDTSALVGYAPLTPTEQLVLHTEQYLNSPAFKARFPESGEDVKVMGVRVDAAVTLTVAMPLLEHLIESEAAYFQRKAAVEEDLTAFVARAAGGLSTTVALNTLDRPGAGIDGVYLSLLGTSAEDADSGQVGRGNRVNGIISLHRPAPAEAAAGKNPISHVGKIYNVLSHHIAGRIYAEVPGLAEVYVWLCSQIGQPVDRPELAAAQVVLQPGVALDRVQSRISEIIDAELAGIGRFTADLAVGRYRVY